MIEVKNLTKKYGEHTAIKDLSFSVEDDQVYGFLGPNGAGKSTTMNIIAGCLSATEGTVIIDGEDIYENAVAAKKKIGYLPEIPPLYTDMTPKEYLEFVADAKKVSKDEKKEQIESVMAETGIKDVEKRLIKNLSKGYRQRVGIAQALIGNPSIVILDEPTVGLDPVQIIEIRELIKNLGHKRTVILSSHILSEVQAVCDRIMIISKGKLVACDTPENLETLFAGSKTLKITAKATADEIEKILIPVEEIKDVKLIDTKDGISRVEIISDRNDEIEDKVFFAFADARKPIIRMTQESASLEDIFIELTKDEKPVENKKIQETETISNDDEKEDVTDDGNIQA